MPVNDELLVNAELVYFEEKGKAWALHGAVLSQ